MSSDNFNYKKLLPRANAPVLVRAQQKDTLFEDELAQRLSRLLKPNPRNTTTRGTGIQPPSPSLVARAIHLCTTVAVGGRTLGDEYVGTTLVSGKRWLYVLLELVLCYLHTANNVSLLNTVLLLHRSLFYWTGQYRSLSLRLAAVEYASTSMSTAATTNTYPLLGILCAAEGLRECIALYSGNKKPKYSTSTAIDSTRLDNTQLQIQQYTQNTCRYEFLGSCPLCMDIMVHPCAAQCGHAFCWNCAHEWANRNNSIIPKCPVCRAPFPQRELVVLR